jgi:hypothetical protein
LLTAARAAADRTPAGFLLGLLGQHLHPQRPHPSPQAREQGLLFLLNAVQSPAALRGKLPPVGQEQGLGEFQQMGYKFRAGHGEPLVV